MKGFSKMLFYVYIKRYYKRVKKKILYPIYFSGNIYSRFSIDYNDVNLCIMLIDRV